MTGGVDRKAAVIAGILLAAGESRRMGETNKLLLPIGRQPLLKRSLSLLSKAECDQSVVVLGHRIEDSAPLVSSSGLPFVINADFRTGQQSSLRAGIKAIGNCADAYLIMLADLPKLELQTLRCLLDAVNKRPEADAWVPTYRGAWGNPRVLSKSWVLRMNEDSTLTTKGLFSECADRVCLVEVEDCGVVSDIDTPDDYRNHLTASMGQRNGLR